MLAGNPLGTPTGPLTATPVPTPSLDCVAEGDAFCQVVLDITDNATLARAADWLIARPVRIVVIVALALLLRYAVRRLVDRVVERLATGRAPSGRVSEGRTRQVVEGANPLTTARLRQRSEAMGSVLKSASSFVIFVVAGMMVLSELGLDLAPLIASAGIAGVALGFGAQNLVKDFLAGVFMIFEDQYGVGDVINMGHAVGTVESVGLRVTQLRDTDGVVWYVRNGEVLRVGNQSQGWATAAAVLRVTPGSDLEIVRAVLTEASDAFSREPEWSAIVGGAPTVSAPDPALDGAQTFVVALRTRPYDQAAVEAELDRRLTRALLGRGLTTQPLDPAPDSR